MRLVFSADLPTHFLIKRSSGIILFQAPDHHFLSILLPEIIHRIGKHLSPHALPRHLGKHIDSDDLTIDIGEFF